MRIHLIAIGGSAMHNLAIALHKKGYQVSGSDDEIVEPSKSRLAAHGLLPKGEGWNTGAIHQDLDAVILGMHARIDNPELLKAQELGLKVFSYPEYLYEQSKGKKRVVVGGSHGKTTITAMILHVLQYAKLDADYLVGAQLKGFDTMVKLTKEAPYIVLEGDEYLASPIDRRPKFHLYKAHTAIISGIAWDHINVFPTFENYKEQFSVFIDTLEPNAALFYAEADKDLKEVVEKHPRTNIRKVGYGVPAHTIRNGLSYLQTETGEVPLLVFGEHNLSNLNGARLVCETIGVSAKTFYEAIQSFSGAAKRLELIAKTDAAAVYKDFAHSPSKLKATIQAVKKQYGERPVTACMELHTFSSLNKAFLEQYKDSMAMADEAIVYYNPHTVAHKKLENIEPEIIREAFAQPGLQVFTDSKALTSFLKEKDWSSRNLLLMSSGNFDGLDIDGFGKSLLQ